MNGCQRLRHWSGQPLATVRVNARTLQSLHEFSLEQTDYLVRDRCHGCGCRLGPEDWVPDADTLWAFREALIVAGALEALFARLDQSITAAEYLRRGGQILDATLVAAPWQRNTDGEKAAIKDGRSAAEIWPEKPARARHKDIGGRWTVKYSKANVRADGTRPVDITIPVHGYKSHVSIDRMHGLIRRQIVTDAGKHDGAMVRWCAQG